MIPIDKQEVPNQNQAFASTCPTENNFSLLTDGKRIFKLVSAGLNTRTQLFFLEAQDLLQALIIKVATILALILLSIFSIISLNIAVVIYFWDTYRTEAALGSVAFFILLIALTTIYLSKQKSLKYFKSFFSETASQLRKDIDQLKGNSNG
ncbi:MAG: phage holin family protein [Pseudomonadota bacterium]